MRKRRYQVKPFSQDSRTHWVTTWAVWDWEKGDYYQNRKGLVPISTDKELVQRLARDMNAEADTPSKAQKALP